MFGKANIQNSNVSEKEKFRFPMFGKSQNLEIPMFGKTQILEF